MKKKIVTVFLAFFLLSGGMILPLGDFSLMKDLPKMYQSYCDIKSGKPDIIDFLGDYVLGGKDIFGHNKKDAPPKSDGSLQFQHQANSLPFFPSCLYEVSCPPNTLISKPVAFQLFAPISDYQDELLRPPLA